MLAVPQPFGFRISMTRAAIAFAVVVGLGLILSSLHPRAESEVVSVRPRVAEYVKKGFTP